MKKLLMILGVIFAALILLLGVSAAIFIPRTLKLDKEATEYIKGNVPKITDGWNSKNLIDRATPELLSEVKSQEEWDRLFAAFQQLGSLRHLDQPKGSVFSGAFTKQGSYTIGNYTVQADFEKGSADISIQLLRVGTEWKINGFHINSDVFFPLQTKPQSGNFDLLPNPSK
jgi:hypothetical protein